MISFTDIEWIRGETDIFLAPEVVFEKNVEHKLRQESSISPSSILRLMHNRIEFAVRTLFRHCD